MELTRPARIYLSPPHLTGNELGFIEEAIESNWVAPVGPHLDAFEREFAREVGASHAVALTSGTAALHLALVLAGVEPDDEVAVSTFTFCASVNPIRYLHARPVFIDSETASWNLDPNLLAELLVARARINQLPKALVVAHIYGQSAHMAPIQALCEQYGIALIEDAAEALGAQYEGQSPGTFGKAGIFSFNGNKVITTSGGGMLVTEDEGLARSARKLATQAREEAPHYEHTQVGYNYRMSNILAGIGRGQLAALKERVAARRAVYVKYRTAMRLVPGISFMPEAPWGRHARWLTCITIDANLFGASADDVRIALNAANIEARPLWKPMHLQPVFEAYERIGGVVSEHLFKQGLCLPSGSNLTDEEHQRIVQVLMGVHSRAQRNWISPV